MARVFLKRNYRRSAHIFFRRYVVQFCGDDGERFGESPQKQAAQLPNMQGVCLNLSV